METVLKYLNYVPTYFQDLTHLVCSPKRFVADRSAESPENWQKSLTFFGVSITICFIALSTNLPEKSELTATMLRAAISWTVEVILIAATVRLAWAAVGGHATFRSTLLLTLYFNSVFRLLSSLFTVVQNKAVEVFSPGWYAALKKAWQHDPGSFLIGSPGSSNIPGAPSWFIFSFLLGFFLSVLWYIMCWGAYRSINGCSRIRSAAAWVICTMCLIPVALILNIIFMALNPAFMGLR